MLHPSQDTAGNVACKNANYSANAGAPVLITAGGTGDNVKITGQSIDRFTGTALADSCTVATGYIAALTAAKTLSFTIEYEHSADNSTWSGGIALYATTVVATGAGNKTGVIESTLNLRGLNRYIRFNVTPDLSHTSTDTCTFHTIAVLGGYDQGPQ